jgi:hypothetical protein
MAILQGVLLAVAGAGATRIVGVLLAAVSVFARTRLLMVVTGLILINFALHLVEITPPFQFRLVHVSVVALYGAIISAGVSAVAMRVKPERALAVALPLTAALIGTEALIGLVSAPAEDIKWIGGPRPDPLLGEVYPAHGELRALYPDNPRGYFAENAPSPWVLNTHHQGSAATLERSLDRPNVLRVNITRAEVKTPFHIQLNEPGIRLEAGESYALRFRARAEGPRRVFVAVTAAHPPWNSLGYYRGVAVDKDWKEFSDTFVLNAGDRNAQLLFNLGDSAIPVELANIALRRTESKQVVKPQTLRTSPSEYFVTFRFNALGCRGDDYPIPRPIGRHRIVALGGGSTLGTGVHERDTFAARLEQSLNAAVRGSVAEQYDVVNCGAMGRDTREDRRFYDLVASRYEPDVVLLSMASTDNISRREAASLGYAHEPGWYEHLFFSAHLFQYARHEGRLTSDYSDSVRELVDLAEACRGHHARLAVVIFRNVDLAAPWSELVATVSSRLAHTDIPLLDLGPALLRAHRPEDLMVHRVDANPNEVAQEVAAHEIERFLRSRDLLH